MLKGFSGIENITGYLAQADLETQKLALSWENTSARSRRNYSASLPRAI